MKELQLLNLKGISERKNANLSSDEKSTTKTEEGKKIIQVESLDYLRNLSSCEQAKMDHRARMDELKLLGLKGITRRKSVNLSSSEGLSDVTSFYSSQKCLKEAMKKRYNESMEFLHKFQNNEVSPRRLKSRSNKLKLSPDVVQEDISSEITSERSDDNVEMDPFLIALSQDSEEVTKNNHTKNNGISCPLENEEIKIDGRIMNGSGDARIDEHSDAIVAVPSSVKTHQKKIDDEIEAGDEVKGDDVSSDESPGCHITISDRVTSSLSDLKSADTEMSDAATAESNLQKAQQQRVLKAKGAGSVRTFTTLSTPKTRTLFLSTVPNTNYIGEENAIICTKSFSRAMQKTGGTLVRSRKTTRSRMTQGRPRKTARTASKLGFVNIISPYSSDHDSSSASSSNSGATNRDLAMRFVSGLQMKKSYKRTK